MNVAEKNEIIPNVLVDRLSSLTSSYRCVC